MDVLIKNMELPKKCDMLMVAIFSDGSVDFKGRGEIKTHRTKAIELPPHGELIERSAVIDIIRTNPLMQSDTVKVGSLVHRVKNVPTILEANYGTDN